jgi:predicted nucleotidyltransferase
MQTYANILDRMNATVKKLAENVERLESNLNDAEDIIKYLVTYNEHIEVRELYHNFFAYCVRNNFDLDSEFNDISLSK